MSEFTVNEMLEMQKTLQEKYKNLWEELSPEKGKRQLLWMIGELGEVIDIVKKHGDNKIIEDKEIRSKFIEELADVLMYFNDILLCYDISSDELKESYVNKYNRNMNRW